MDMSVSEGESDMWHGSDRWALGGRLDSTDQPDPGRSYAVYKESFKWISGALLTGTGIDR